MKIRFNENTLKTTGNVPYQRGSGIMTHNTHEDHTHTHGADCGHVSFPHGDHTDYLHEGHIHREHDGHWDECETTEHVEAEAHADHCLLYTSPSPRDS